MRSANEASSPCLFAVGLPVVVCTPAAGVGFIRESKYTIMTHSWYSPAYFLASRVLRGINMVLYAFRAQGRRELLSLPALIVFFRREMLPWEPYGALQLSRREYQHSIDTTVGNADL